MRRLALLAVALLAAGCDGSNPTTTFDFQDIRECLGGGTAQIRLPGIPQTFRDLRVPTRGDVLVAPTVGAAREFFAIEQRGDAKAVLRKNAVVVWAPLATPTWRRHVFGCLK